jgi:hypothetical protein
MNNKLKIYIPNEIVNIIFSYVIKNKISKPIFIIHNSYITHFFNSEVIDFKEYFFQKLKIRKCIHKK